MHTTKKRESESILNISRKVKDETVLSNSYVLTVISNFLDLNENKTKPKKVSQSQRKKSSQKNLGQKKSSKTVYKDIKDIPSIEINKSVESKDLSKKKVNKLLSLDFNKRQCERKSSAKELMKNRISNYSQNKLDLGKVTNMRRRSTVAIGEVTKSKYKDSFLNLEKNNEEILLKRKKTTRTIRKKINNRVNSFNVLNNSKKKRRNSSLISNLRLNLKEKENNNEIITILALRKIHKKLKNNIENKIKDKLYEYENNDITDAINKLPTIEPNDKSKKVSITITNEYSVSDKNSMNLDNNVTNKLFKDDIDINLENEKENQRRDKRRFFTLKGNIYDSLDDEEIIDEEIVENFFFEPDSTFLYFFDSIIMISSFIILIYLPLFIAENISFCHSFLNINNIIFYFIDFMFIIDVIISFFRAYYNFDEILVRKSNDMCIHYLKTWFFFDLITSVPVFSLIKFLNNKCTNEGNSLLFSHYYNINLNNLHYLFTFGKVIKIFKVFKSNISVQKLSKILNQIEFISDWGNVYIFLLFLLFSINLSACIFIFIGRNTYHSWIVRFKYENLNFFHIYIAAIYYIIFTITSVGYGDLLGNTLLELIFQTIVLIAGTCIYSWLISAASSYIKKINDRKLKYENKIKILEEIRLTNPHLTRDLYEKIIRLLNYRKYYEQIDKQVILDFLPYSLRNSLTIEMYKPFINNFIFFKAFKNKRRDFVVQVVSKLKPVLAVKGDMLIQEGDFIEDIIFVKEGVLSLEIKISLDYPDKSIEEYLSKYKLISKKTKNNINNETTSNLLKGCEIMTSESFKSKLSELSRETTFSNANILNKFQNNFTKNICLEDDKNTTFIKIINIRKNEHYGDVYMFLNTCSPLYVRVRTKKAEVLLLKKLDAVTISTTYPRYWKKIIARSLMNTKKIKNLTLKMLITFCNFHGIKTKFFKQQKYSIYDIKSSINESGVFLTKRKVLPLNTEIQKTLKEINYNGNNYEDYINSSYDNSDASQTYSRNSKNERNDINTVIYEKQEEENISDDNLQSKFKSTFLKSKTDLMPLTSLNSEKYMNNINNEQSQRKTNLNSSSKLDKKNKTEKNTNNSDGPTKVTNSNNKLNKDNNKKESSINDKSKSFSSSNLKSSNDGSQRIQKIDDIDNNNNSKEQVNNLEEKNTNKTINININDINDEIYSGESFNLHINDGKIKNTNQINNNFYPQKIYINNLNIFENPNKNKEKALNSEEKKFKNLEISSASTIDINSSYENINQITNYNYISDDDLRKKTKKFLMEECNIYLSEKSLEKKASVPKVNKNYNPRKSGSSNVLNTILKKNKNISNERNASLRSSFKNSNKFKLKVPELKRDFSLKINSSLGSNKSLYKSNFYKKERDKFKKNKNDKEMVMISNNIKENTENLNNPESFYTGLFHNILEKRKKSTAISSNYLFKCRSKLSPSRTKK